MSNDDKSPLLSDLSEKSGEGSVELMPLTTKTDVKSLPLTSLSSPSSSQAGTGNWLSYREVCVVNDHTYLYGYEKHQKDDKLVRNTLYWEDNHVTFKIHPDHAFHGMVVSMDETVAVITTLCDELVYITLHNIKTSKRLSRYRLPYSFKRNESVYTLDHVIGIWGDHLILLLTRVNQTTLFTTHELVFYSTSTPPKLKMAYRRSLSWNQQSQQYLLKEDGIHYVHHPLFPDNAPPEPAFVPFPKTDNQLDEKSE